MNKGDIIVFICAFLFAGALLLGEGMGVREIIGCILMFAAIVVAQLPSSEK